MTDYRESLSGRGGSDMTVGDAPSSRLSPVEADGAYLFELCLPPFPVYRLRYDPCVIILAS
jgi:hypothetical protein